MLLGRLDELLVHGFKHFEIAVYNHIHRSVALNAVALYVAYQAFVVVGIDIEQEYLDLSKRGYDELTKNGIENIISRKSRGFLMALIT